MEGEEPSQVGVSIWDVSTRTPMQLKEVKVAGANGIDLRFSRDGRHLVLTYKCGSCRSDQKFMVAVLDAQSLRIKGLFNAHQQLRHQSVRFADLLWDSEYLVFFDQLTKVVSFHPVDLTLGQQAEQQLGEPAFCFDLLDHCRQALGVIDFNNFLLNELQPDTIYTVTVEEGAQLNQMFSQNLLRIRQHPLTGVPQENYFYSE